MCGLTVSRLCSVSFSHCLLRRPRSAWVYQHCTAVYCIYSGIEWHFQWPQKFFWRIIFTDSFGQNISVPYFGNFSHLELPDNIGRIRSLHLILFLCCSLCFNSVLCYIFLADRQNLLSEYNQHFFFHCKPCFLFQRLFY